MSSKPLIVYLAARGFERDLLDELKLHGVRVRDVKERLVLAEGLFRSAWAQNIWLEPFFQPIVSVGDAVRTLKAIQRNWKLHPVDFHRRAAGYDGNCAMLFTDINGPVIGKNLFDFRRQCSGRYIVIIRRLPHQRIPHRTANRIRSIPRLFKPIHQNANIIR